MRGKATKSGEQVDTFNVYKYFKVHNPSESQNFLLSVHQKLQDHLYQQLEGLSNKVMGLKGQVKNRKEEFSKLDEFDSSVMYKTNSP